MSTSAPALKLSRTYRRFLLTLHVITSVGWLGLSLANIALAVTVNTTDDPRTQHAVYRTLEIVGTTVILPISVAALVTGVLLSIGTQWGLIRYRWVLVKLALTVLTVALTYVSLVPGLREASAIVDATEPGRLAPIDGSDLLAAAFVSTTIYTLNTVLSVFKPWGRTRWGRRAVTRDRAAAIAA